MDGVVYHYTSLGHLPFILLEGYLVPSGPNKDWPKDVLWATTNPNGDRTTAICRSPEAPRVRITLPGETFGAWRQVIAQDKAWDERHIRWLLDGASVLKQPTDEWVAQSDDFDMNDAIAIDLRRPNVPWAPVAMRQIPSEGGEGIWFKAAGNVWYAERGVAELGGPLVYAVKRVRAA